MQMGWLIEMEPSCTIATSGYKEEEAIDEDWKTIQSQIPEVYHKYWEVFSKQASYRFPPTWEEDHAITLKEGVPDKIDCKIYHQTAEELEATRQFITESLAKGYIMDSKSLYASTVFYHKKKDGNFALLWIMKP